MARFGFKEMIGPNKFFYPFKLSSITNKKAKWATKTIGSWTNPVLFYTINISRRIDLENYKVPIEEIDSALVISKIVSNRCYVVHDIDYYNWRIGSFKDYQKEGEVFQSKDEFLAIIRYSNTIGFLVEFVYKDIQQARKLLVAITRRMYEKGMEEMKFVTHDKKLMSFLRSIGFIKSRTKVDTIYISRNENFNKNVIAGQTLFDYTLIDCDENI